MLNYYEILGISRHADIPEIKKVYKALALKYHPDRNPDNPVAEEKIKQINEAYGILSDPYKKASHDLQLSYADQKRTQAYTPPPTYRRPKAKTERSIYDRYGKYVWNERPQYHEAPAYKIDKTYVRNQLIAFGAVAILAIIIIAGYNFNEYLKEQKELKITEQNSLVIQDARELFDNGQYRSGINMMTDLIKKYPIRRRPSAERKNMVEELRTLADNQFDQGIYEQVIENLEIVRDFERPMRLKTWRMIADSYLQLGRYRKAVHAYDYVLLREESNVELMITIADIYLDELSMQERALEYYSKARQTFRRFQVANYGEAYELVMRPENLPPIYYNMFSKRAELNVALGNYKEAIKDYNWAVTIKPEVAENYHFRAICRLNTNNTSRACSDWKRAVDRGNVQSREMINLYCR